MSTVIKPAVVLVHGAWHAPSHFQSLIDRLESSGHEVTAVKLASVGTVAVPEPFSKDVAIVKEAILNFTSRGKNVVVAMHSYGGVPGSEAVAEVFEDSKLQTEGNGRIVHLFYMPAVIIPKGVTIMEDDVTPHTFDLDEGLLYHLEPYQRFYTHCSPRTARTSIELLQPHALETLLARTKYAGWGDYGVPVTYVACTQDVAMEYVRDQLRFKRRFEERGVQLEWKELDCDHSPWLSREEEFWGILKEVLEKASKAAST